MLNSDKLTVKTYAGNINVTYQTDHQLYLSL